MQNSDLLPQSTAKSRLYKAKILKITVLIGQVLIMKKICLFFRILYVLFYAWRASRAGERRGRPQVGRNFHPFAPLKSVTTIWVTNIYSPLVNPKQYCFSITFPIFK